jgi:membrane protease YdiL (CAAX protease family)
MTALTVVPVRSSALRRFATRHPIAAFLTLFFLIAYPLMSLIALAALGLMPGGGLLARLPVAPDEVAGLVLTMGALFPAALYVTWATEGRSGVKRLIRRTVRWRFGLRWWLVILTALPLLTVAAGLLLGDSLRSVEPVRLLLHQVPLLLVNLLLVNLWEETAWAGFLQTRLERRHNVFTAALLTAVPFGFAHWPLALFDPTVSVGSVLVALPGYLLLGALVRPLLGLTLRATGNSLLGVALMHSLVNRTQNPNGIAAGLLEGAGHQLGFLIVLVVLTGVLALALRPKLSREYRRRLDGTTTP